MLAALGGDPDADPDALLTLAEQGRAEQAWERSYVAAARATVDGGRWGSLQAWRRHHDEHPDDVLAMEVLAPSLVLSADAALIGELADRVRRTLRVVGDDAVLLGHLGVEVADHGDIAEAERLGTRALALEPELVVAGHPMAHVHYERGEHEAGAHWLGEWLPTTPDEVEYRDHLVWHEALHHLALGNRDVVLERYAEIGTRSQMSRVTGGTSLLWRCQLHGLVPVGEDPVTPTVGEVVQGIAQALPVVAAAWHAALGLAAVGDVDGLRRASAAARDADGPGVAELLPDVFAGLADHLEGDHTSAADGLATAIHQFDRLGGSRAQREVLEDTYIECLVRADRDQEAIERLEARLDRRPSRFDERWLARARAD